MSRVPTRSAHRLQRDLLKEPYARILIPEEDGTYSADILEFPGCHAFGATPGEAIANLENAAAAWIEAAIEQGQEIPSPLATYGYSGKINLRLPKSIHRQAARFAAKDEVSLNHFFTSAIAARVGAEEFYERLVQRLESRLSPVVFVTKTEIQNSSTLMLLIPSPGGIPQNLRTESDVQQLPPFNVDLIKDSANA